MARKGEGDPRWIVQERDDGKNVNNWHWTETDLSGWAIEKLKELLGNFTIESKIISGKTTDITTTADVSVNTRKQKTLLFYELHVTIKWEASLKDAEKPTKGTILLPYISDENDLTDFEIKFTVEGESKEDEKIKDEIKQIMTPILKQKVPEMLTGLKEVALGKTNLQLKQTPVQKLDKLDSLPIPATLPPPAIVQTNNPKPTPTTTTTTTTKSSPATVVTIKKSGIRTATVKAQDKFICRPVDLFHCFTEANRVKAYAGGDAQINAEKGGKFNLFSGVVSGENVEVVFPTKIIQKWRFSSWPENHYSIVTIEFEDKNGKTALKLEQTGVPEEDKERTEAGWQENFFKRIKGIFGYGPLY